MEQDEAKPERKEAMAGLAKGLAILESFGNAGGRLTIAEAARAAGLSRPTARRCLLTLHELGYVGYDGRYFTPLPRLLRLGYAFFSSTPLPRLAEPVLDALQAETSEAVSLAILDGAEVVFVARATPRRMVTVGPSVGSRLPAWCSATGRVLLAALPDSAMEQVLAGVSIRPLTPQTVRTREAARDRVLAARADGFAVSDEELEAGLRSLAVPVRDLAGHVTAALSVSTQVGRTSLETLHGRFLPLLQDGSRRLSDHLRG